MALMRARILRIAKEHKSLPLLSTSLTRESSTTTAKTKASLPRTGFLEQMRRDLLPEVFGLKHDPDSPSPARKKPHTSPTNSSDERDHDFRRMLVRPQTTHLRDLVISRYANEPAPRAVPLPPQLIVLDGPQGVGKSSVLEQTAAFARMKGYLVVYIPCPEEWTHGGSFFAAATVEEKNPVLDGLAAVRFYDRPTQIHAVFKAMLETHRDDLAEIECQEQLATKATAECVTLLDLVELGDRLLNEIDINWRDHPTLAGEVFHRFVNELCACDSKPVAIIIDNYEHFTGLTCMENERKVRLHSNCIRTVAEHFGRDAIERTAKSVENGFVLLATDPKHRFEDWRGSRVQSGIEYPLSVEIRKDPSGRKWLEDLKVRISDKTTERSVVVKLDELTSSELKTLCATFVNGGLKRLIDDHNPGPEEERLVALAGGRADVMRKIAVSR